MRHLVVVLGDQLDERSAAFDGFDPSHDRVWMAEVPAESTHVWSHQARIALFLAAMRHFARSLEARGISVLYRSLEDVPPDADLGSELAIALREHRPERVILTEPGEHRVEVVLQDTARRAGVPLEVRDDRHFFCSRERFARHRRGRKQLRLEYFYREMRREHGVLLDDGAPVGGAWNYDAENRKAFPRSGPGEVPRPLAFPPDPITRDVLDLVARRFGSHPGSLEAFDWPVTPADAEHALEDFLRNRLPSFGDTQDAMWTDEPVLYHSRLSAALNLKLLDPRDVVSRAEREYRAGRAPLAAVEGFIRQILGWREFVRGVYWSFMPEYLERNALDAREPLPGFYWTANTDLNCLHQTLAQTLATGYAHHIQRLMVTGLFALLLGVDPREVHRWYLAIYVDAVEWVELPNTLGMSQFGDGGVLASKPYIASGKYVDRMSDYCRGCRYDPSRATGERACPLTTLYWDFLARHRARFASHPRLRMQIRNLERKTPREVEDIRRAAERLRSGWRAESTDEAAPSANRGEPGA